MTSRSFFIVIGCLVALNLILWMATAKNRGQQVPYEGEDGPVTNLENVGKLLEKVEKQLKLAEENFANSKNQTMGKFDRDIILKDVRDKYKSQATERNAVLNQITTGPSYQILYNALAPEAYCMKRVRIGGVLDGGKWVCAPWNVPKKCNIISLGLANLMTFDEEIQQATFGRCRILGVDSAEQNDFFKQRYAEINGTVQTAFVSNVTNTSIKHSTIEDLAKSANMDKIEFLKIDIEGAESYALEPFLKEYQFCQIFIELHGESYEMLQNLRMISKYGFRLFSFEINGYTMGACEFSFIHESCYKKYDVYHLANYLTL